MRFTASSVSATNFWSGTLAPSTATPSGTPRPSISVERLTPSLPRSVGFFPVFFPTQRRFGHRPVHTLPPPVDPFQIVVDEQGQSPQFLKHAQLDPLLKIVVDGAARAKLAGHRLPVAAGSQHIQNPACYLTHLQPRTTTFTTAFVN